MSPSEAPATFYVIEGGNDISWRARFPAAAIGAKLNVIPEVGGYYAITQPNMDTAFRWRFDPDADDNYIEYPDHEGVAVWTRPDLARATHAKAMREQLGIRTIAEVDDNYLSDPRLNVFMRYQGFDAVGRLDHMKATVSMGRIVVTTEWLRDTYAKTIRKQFGKSVKPEIHICRNNVPEDKWPERVESDGPVRVGWMGSPSHVWDVDLAWAALLYAKRLGCEVWMIGYNPADPSAEHPSFSKRSTQKEKQWGKVGFKHIPWQAPSEHHRFPLPLDIGLCPLLRNEHTLGKSDVKHLEYAISGAATIAMNNEVYNRTIVHMETGILCGSPSEMLNAVDLLVKDEKLRLRLVANAQQYIREERGEKQLREEWSTAIA